MFARAHSSPTSQYSPMMDVGPLLATEIAIEFCPTGIYIFPTPETLLRWSGVFFVHRGSVLRFTLSFPHSFPRTRPAIHFDSDVFHPLVDPKTREWIPSGRLAQWQPRVDHVAHLLHALKASFKTAALEAVTEHDAANKQVFSMFKHSPQTFNSLTSQRARHSSTRQVLYGEPDGDRPHQAPVSSSGSLSLGTSSPSTPPRSHASLPEHLIRFTEIDDETVGRLWADLRRSLGEK